MAIIVNCGNGYYEKIESGSTVLVTETGCLVIFNGHYRVAAYPSGSWYGAARAGDCIPVNREGGPVD